MKNTAKEIVFLGVAIFMLIALFGVPLAESLGGSFSFFEGLSKNIAKYVFGVGDPSSSLTTMSSVTPYAYIVIFLMLWLIFFVTFGDILETFSTFKESTSWIISLCLAVIGGMTGVYNKVVGTLLGLFINAGAFAIYFSLLVCIALFLFVELGLGAFFPKVQRYILQRKLLQQELRVSQGIHRAGSTLVALKEMGDQVSGENGDGI
jgi:hypothetical protein